MRNNQIRDIAYMGMYLALFFVFDWLANAIGLFQMPEGGSLGISVIPLLLCSYMMGWKKGTAVCLLAVLLMTASRRGRLPSSSSWNIRLPSVSMDWLHCFRTKESSIPV